MIDEREELKAYTGVVQYTAAGKRDRTWKGRFTVDMLLDFQGFARILTILARGYLFDGVGWLVRHVRRMCAFTVEHPDVVSKPDASDCGKLAKGFEREWRRKVVQLQVPIFAPNTQAAWGLRFDDVLADALELGPLRSLDVSFSPALEQRVEEATPRGVPTEFCGR